MAEAAVPSIAVQLQRGFQFPGARHVGLMLTVAVFAAVLVAGYMWSQAPDYRILFPNVSDRDSGEIAAALEGLNIPYKFGEHGTLMIPENQLFKARAQLAVKGLPKGASSNAEQTERPPFGESESDMRSRHQRGLAVDLARSIETLAGVQTARVHLALSKPSPFMREQSKSTASVVLGLHPGRTLDSTQVSAIVHMVSNAVPDLRAANVAVVDQAGNLLSTQQNGARGAIDATQLRFRQDMEQGFNSRIEAILTPLAGAHNVRAQVAAELDFSESEEAQEIYKPNGSTTAATIRSQQVSEATNGGGNGAGGVPGALSNQPPAPATAPINAPAAAPGATAQAAAAPATSLRKDATTNFEVDKSIRHTRQELGRIKRLAVAVVVNHKKTVNSAGKVSYTPLKDEELAQITNLVKEVVAYNKERGDTVSVINSAFSVPEKEKVVEVPLWKQPETIELAKMIGKNLLIAGVLLFVVLRVLRPALKSFSPPPPSAAPALTDESGADGAQSPQQQVDNYEQQVRQAKQIARDDPKAAANMVKEWVANGR